MRFTARTWAILSVILFTGGFYSWYTGNQIQARRKAVLEQGTVGATNPASGGVLTNLFSTAAFGSSASKGPLLTSLRVANTSQSIRKLSVSDTALLLRNALIDTSTGETPEIPEQLRTEGEASSYVVQAKGVVTAAFRKTLRDHGAELVSYIPNNAYLVRIDPAQVEALRTEAGVGAMVVFEPYYKLAGKLLQQAVDDVPIAPDAVYRLTLFAGQEDVAREWFENQGGEVLAVDRSPFGPQLVVRPPSVPLANLARLDSVQWVEQQRVRVSANDLTRVYLGVSADQTNTTNFLGLTGDKIVVNINDFGFDTNYAALKDRFLLGGPILPTNNASHGTFVAVTLAGDGAGSDTVTNLSGSPTNGINLRGIADKAKLFALPLIDRGNVHDFVTDAWLQHTAAATNYVVLTNRGPMISNNSWVYENSGEYDSAAARYDSAVRDSLPEVNGPQGMVFLFPAGNNGDGNEEGTGGESDSIRSPATAKNVITVGAVEQFRNMTNSYVVTNIVKDEDSGTLFTNVVTNTPFLKLSDSSSEVASFSSRGNVGIGVEGEFGRFKPDVVAPGTMIVSGRSKDFKLEERFDTNSVIYPVLSNIDKTLGEYRMESGTSFAVPGVSGLLVLMQEFFEHTLPVALRRSLSPALSKALLINGSRSVNGQYSLETKPGINYQGWGSPSLPRILSTNMLTLPEASWPLRIIDQSASNALATGQSRTWNVVLSEEASRLPLRFTLVWTDPPGNPGAGIKLVNDLDLIVTNLDVEGVFIGNDFGNSSDFVFAREYVDSENDDVYDKVNNVENIFIQDPSLYGTNFTVTVRARRVNVNAIGDFFAEHTPDNLSTNDVVQDFALVMSTDLINTTNVFTITKAVPFPVLTDTHLPPTTMTNGLPLFEQRVGANATLVSTNGITNQWHFFVFTNLYIPNGLTDITNGSNVAFAIFNPPNLSTPRVLDADLDLYVSRDSNLFSLNPVFLASSAVDRSVERGGEELLVYSNGTPKDVFYVAVKSEDQKAAEFSILSISSDSLFERDGPNGSRILTGFPGAAYIPDGSGYRPRAGIVMAVGLSSFRARRVVVTNDITHQLLGDLVGVLRHNRHSVTLNNHTLNNGQFEGFTRLIYNDSGVTVDTPNSIVSDGPGSLRNFLGIPMTGAWILAEIDNQPVHTGRVSQVSIRVDPLPPSLKDGILISGVLDEGGTICYPVDVPAGVTNLILRLTQKDVAPLPLRMYIKKDDLPTATINDGVATAITPGNYELQVGLTNNPPISPGTWYVCIDNPNTIPVGYDLLALFEYGAEGDNQYTRVVGGFGITDEAFTTGSIFQPRDTVVAGTRVGLRVDHSRVSDLSIHLITPQGTRLLLMENRGGTNEFGLGSVFTNSFGNLENSYFTLSDSEFVTTPVKFLKPPFADFGTNRGQVFFNGFEGAAPGIYSVGENLDGWVVKSNKVNVIGAAALAASGNNSVSLGSGAITTNLPTEPGRPYQLRFKHRLAPVIPLFSTGKNATNTDLLQGQADLHYFLASSADPKIPLGTPVVAAAASYWIANDAKSQWITPKGYHLLSANPGVYTYRTSFTLTGDPLNARITGIWAADNGGFDILVNGKSTRIAGSGHTVFNAPILTSTNLILGLNTMDLVTTNAGAPTGVRAQLQLQTRSTATAGFSNVVYALPVNSAGSFPGSFALELEGSFTNTYASAADYRTVTINFFAAATNQSLTFASLLNGLAQIDDVELIDTGTVFAKPEEPFELINGELAKGIWRLEVEDFRTGAPLGDGVVVSWRLELDVSPAFPPSEIMRNGATYPTTLNNQSLTNPPSTFIPGRVAKNEVQYFYIPYCSNSTDLFVTLIGSNNFGGLVMYADHSGFPTGNPLTDDYVPLLNNQNFPSTNGAATLHITDLRPYGAPLNPAEPIMFVAVANQFVDSTNYFTLRVDYDGICSAPFLFALASGQTNSLAVSSATANGVAGRQQLTFNVGPESTTASLALRAGDQSTLLATLQGPVEGGPQLTTYFEIGGGVPFVVMLSAGSSTAPIRPGTYIVTVDNPVETPTLLTASYQESDPAGGNPPLDLNIPQTFTIRADSLAQRDVSVGSNPSRLVFEVAGRPPGVDIQVMRLEDGVKMVSYNGQPLVWTILNSQGSLNGTYRVTVINNTGAPADVTLLASQPDSSGMVVSVEPLQLGISADQRTLSFLSLVGERYSLESSTDLTGWLGVSSVTATSGRTSISLPSPESTVQFFRLQKVAPQ